MRHISSIIAFELKRGYRNAHLVLFVIFFLGALLWVGVKLGKNADTVTSSVEQSLTMASQAQAMAGMAGSAGAMPLDVLGIVAAAAGPEVMGMLKETSPMMGALFLFVMFFVPFLALILGAEQTAAEISRKHTRFLLTRMTRTELFVGKFVAVVIQFAIPAFVFMAIMGVVMGAMDPSVKASGDFVMALRIAATITIYALPFFAIMSFLNTVVPQPFLGILIVVAYWLANTGISCAGSCANQEIQKIEYGFPTIAKLMLVSPDGSTFMTGVGIVMGFTALFFALGLVVFKHRDL